MSHPRCLTVALALLLHACGPSAADRCSAINLAAVLHETWVEADARIERVVEDSGHVWTTRDAEADVRRRGRVSTAAENTAWAVRMVRSQDSLRALLKRTAKPGGDTLGSLADDTPPPTPSDLTWYAEKCWQGVPR